MPLRLLPVFLLMLGMGVIASACGSSGDTTMTVSGSVSGELSGAAPAVSTEDTFIPIDAAAVIEAMAKVMPTMKASISYTAEDDPNHLLGRPGGYTSKSTFVDSRIDPADAQTSSIGSVDIGGGVEIFADSAGANERATTIFEIEKTTILSNEYLYTSGGVLLRLSSVLTPTEAQAYADALSGILGRDVESATK